MDDIVIVTEFGFKPEVTQWFTQHFHTNYPVKIYGCLDDFQSQYQYIPLPNQYRRVDRLGVAYCFAYWILDNSNYKKIIHIDNDVLIKDYKIIDQMIQDLDTNYITGIKENPVRTFLFGMRTECFENKDFDQLTKELFNYPGDFMRNFLRGIFAQYPTKTIHAKDKDTTHIHYLGLQCALDFLEQLETINKIPPTMKHKLQAGLDNLLEWVNTYNIDLTIGNLQLNPNAFDQLTKRIQALNINWPQPMYDLEKEL